MWDIAADEWGVVVVAVVNPIVYGTRSIYIYMYANIFKSI